MKDDITECLRNQNSQVLLKIKEPVDLKTDNIEKGINNNFLDRKPEAVLILASVGTNSIEIEIAKKINKEKKDKQLTLFTAMSSSEIELTRQGGEVTKEMIVISPCMTPVNNKQTKKYIEYNKRWTDELTWRRGTSYDAIQAFAKVIKNSSQESPSRQEILHQIQSPSFSLSDNETSGFGLKWDFSDRSNANRPYCVRKNNGDKFVDITENINNSPVK